MIMQVGEPKLGDRKIQIVVQANLRYIIQLRTYTIHKQIINAKFVYEEGLY